jgi:hypothetical protein
MKMVDECKIKEGPERSIGDTHVERGKERCVPEQKLRSSASQRKIEVQARSFPSDFK